MQYATFVNTLETFYFQEDGVPVFALNDRTVVEYDHTVSNKVREQIIIQELNINRNGECRDMPVSDTIFTLYSPKHYSSCL